jgi:hypothetical protein
MPQMAMFRPLHEAHLHNELRFNPGAFGHLFGGEAFLLQLVFPTKPRGRIAEWLGVSR